MENVSLDQKLEAILFYKAAPLKKATLVKTLEIDTAELTTAVKTLSDRLQAGATRIIDTETELTLVTAPELDTLIESLRKDEMKRDIGKAGAETLAIVLYRGPISRGEIDRVRGVNSSYILRHLMVRGLVEKGNNTKRVEYQATSDLLAHLGITDKTKLPQYETILNTLDSYEQQVATTES